jgi:hypothetical protein
MRGWTARKATCIAALASACATGALAQDPVPVPAIPPSPELSGGAHPERFLLYGGFDIWHYGYGGYVGAQWAPRGLNNDGFVLSVFASDGVHRFDTASIRYRTTIFRAAIMPGWRFKRGNLEVKVFAGPDFERDDYSPVSVAARPHFSQFGARIAADLWWEPNRQMMVAASASATSIARGYSARAATGYRVFDVGWIGPEIAVSADRFSEQYRIGAHLTGVKMAGFEWSLATGYVHDSFDRDGIYGRINLLTRR